MSTHDVDRPAPEGASAGDGVSDVVRVALAVPGVTAVRVEPAAVDGGGSMVRLELADGADEAQVARAVDEALRSRRPPAPRASDEHLPARPPAAAPAPLPVAGPVAGPAGHADQHHDGPGELPVSAVAPAASTGPAPARAGRPRTGRLSVPSLASPTVAATPAPSWLGESGDAPADEPLAAPSAPPAEQSQQREQPAAGSAAGAGARLVLDRVEVASEALATRASVVLRRGASSHTGVAEAAATSSGSRRAVATATVRALESVLGGAVRVEVEAVSVAAVGGAQTAVVLLDAATSRGPEQLVGAALVRRGEDDAVVRAVLDAANRRAVLDLR